MEAQSKGVMPTPVGAVGAIKAENVQSEYIALSGWVIPISKTMQSHGIDVQAAFDACGIAAADLENLESRMAVAKLSSLVAYCNARLSGKDFSVQVGQHFHPGMFHALGYAMMSSASLEDALLRIVRYKRVLSNACWADVCDADDGLAIRTMPVFDAATGKPALGRWEIEIFLATLVTFAREAVDATLRPLRVTFHTPPPEQGAAYLEAFFGCDIQFNADCNTLVFDREQAAQKLLTHNMMLTQSHEKMLDDYLSRVDQSDLANRVKCRIQDRLALGTPTQADIANTLGMSLRNLQRKLSEQGTSFKDILEQTRKTLALEYIDQPHLTLGEIGYLVGFASSANFNRAFKRWTGISPGEYRINHAVTA